MPEGMLMIPECDQPLPGAARDAVALFNAGEYYAQHDAFEALWAAEPGPVRDLYRAILQVGVGYYQITRGNERGAWKMLKRAERWLALLPDICQGVDLAALRADAAVVRAELERRARLADPPPFDRALLKPVRLIETTHGPG
jgi:predicted metal-dependent hydrolase